MIGITPKFPRGLAVLQTAVARRLMASSLFGHSSRRYNHLPRWTEAVSQENPMLGMAVLRTELGNLNVRRGKVRDVYDLGDALLIVASDRR